MMNILLPTDFSDNAKNAAIYAMQLFREVPCHFHLLHVLQIPIGAVGSNHVQMSSGVKQQFDLLLDFLNSIKPNPEHQFHVSFKTNFLLEAVRQQVQEKNIDLILMGTKGATNAGASVIGKNTSDVMMKVKCPVLAISENAVFNGHREVLFPTDYKVSYGGKMLSTLLDFISMSKASVNILEIFNSEKEPTNEQGSNKIFLQNSFLPNTMRTQTYYRTKDDFSKVLQSNHKVDMIVLAAKNLDICYKLLNHQQNDPITFINKLPLLVLH
ncbi:MAG TPA: universal stress protein [Salinimicrobium sp.]|nr:universal stress protein [Salinimicrobium sp.]